MAILVNSLDYQRQIESGQRCVTEKTEMLFRSHSGNAAVICAVGKFANAVIGVDRMSGMLKAVFCSL